MAKNDNFGKTSLHIEKRLARYVKRVDSNFSYTNRVVNENSKAWRYGLDIVRSLELAVDPTIIKGWLKRCPN